MILQQELTEDDVGPVAQALATIANALRRMNIEPQRSDPTQQFDCNEECVRTKLLPHLAWLCDHGVEGLEHGSVLEAARSLGVVQGALAALGLTSISQLAQLMKRVRQKQPVNVNVGDEA